MASIDFETKQRLRRPSLYDLYAAMSVISILPEANASNYMKISSVGNSLSCFLSSRETAMS